MFNPVGNSAEIAGTSAPAPESIHKPQPEPSKESLPQNHNSTVDDERRSQGVSVQSKFDTENATATRTEPTAPEQAPTTEQRKALEETQDNIEKKVIADAEKKGQDTKPYREALERSKALAEDAKKLEEEAKKLREEGKRESAKAAEKKIAEAQLKLSQAQREADEIQLKRFEDKEVERARRDTKGSERDVESQKKALDEMGIIDRAMGTKGAQEKSIQNAEALLEERRNKQKEMEETQRNANTEMESAKAAEKEAAKALEEGKVEEARQKMSEAAEHRQKSLQIIAGKSGSVDLRKHLEATRAVTKDFERAAAIAEGTYIVGKTIQTGTVIVSATAATIATGGVAGVVIGAAAGTGMGVVNAAAEQGTYVARGEKTIDQAASDFKSDVYEYGKTAASTAVATAVGVGAGNIGGNILGVGKAVGRFGNTVRLGANGAQSGAAAGASSSIVNDGIAVAAGEKQFEGKSTGEILTKMAQNAAWGAASGAVGGAVGSVGGIVGEAARSTAGKVATKVAEIAADAGTGIAVEATRASVEGRDFSGEEAGQQALNALLGSIVGKVSNVGHRGGGGAGPVSTSGGSPATAGAAGIAVGASKGSSRNRVAQAISSHPEPHASPKIIDPGPPMAGPVPDAHSNQPRNDHERIHQSLAGRSPHEPVVIGRSGDVAVGQNNRGISREHLTVQRLPNGNWRLQDGIPVSKNGTYLNHNSNSIAGRVQLLPGDVITVGNTDLRIPKRPSGDLSPNEALIWSKLEAGQRVTIGRGDNVDINLRNDRGVSRNHCSIEKGADGNYYLHDGKPSSKGSEYFDKGQWKPFERAEVKPGTRVRLGKEFEFTLPRDDRPVHLKVDGVEWQAAQTPAKIISQSAHSSYPSAVTLDGQHAKVYGASGREIRNLEKALGANESNPLQHIKEIHVVDSIGEIILPGGKEQPIHAFPADSNGRVLIERNALKNAGAAEAIVRELDAIHTRLAEEAQARMTYTKEYVEELQKGQHFLDAQGGAAKHGYYGERPILGRDVPYNGSVNPRGHGRHGNKPAFGMVIDDVRYPQFNKAYNDFYEGRAKQVAQNYRGAAAEENLIKAAFAEVYEKMRYDKGADDAILERHGIVPYAKKGEMPKVNFGEYIEAGRGVCEHQAMYAGYLIERLKHDGILSRDVHVSHERNRTAIGGHSWARIELSDGRVWVIDPAQRYVGPINGDHDWIYMRDSDRQEHQNKPIWVSTPSYAQQARNRVNNLFRYWFEPTEV